MFTIHAPNTVSASQSNLFRRKLKNKLIQILDAESKLSVLMADCTKAAGDLSRSHLCGSTAATCFAEALAAVSLLGAETAQKDETVTLRLDCSGPLEGFLVESTADFTLRGYTKKKILNDFDGSDAPEDSRVFGENGTFEIIRSRPGAILSSGSVAVAFGGKPAVACGIDAYFTQSLQRRVRTAFAAASGDDGVPVYARGVLVECAPDGDEKKFAEVAELFDNGSAMKMLASEMISARTLLKKLGLAKAGIRRTNQVSFACRCSAQRARDMLAALSSEERAQLPSVIDITCHMCGRTWSIPNGVQF